MVSREKTPGTTRKGRPGAPRHVRTPAGILRGLGIMLSGVSLACGGSPLAAAGTDDAALERATALRAEGKFDEALDLLRLESRGIKEADGDDSLRLLPVNDLAAEILIDKGEAGTAATLLDKTITAREKLVASGAADQSAPLGRSLLTRARLETASQRLPAAAAAARRALSAFDAAPGRDPAGIARARETLEGTVAAIDTLLGVGAAATREARGEAALAFASLGLDTAAIEQRHRILDGVIQRGDAPPTEIVDATDRLAKLMLMAGRAEEALPIVEKSLAALGSANPREATAIRRLLGDLQRAAGRLAAARGTYTVVLESTQAEPKPVPSILAGDRLRKLLVDVRRGDVDRLPDWFESTVKSLAKPVPAEVATASPALVLAAEVRGDLGDAAGAVDVLARALAGANTAKPPDAGQVADLAGRLVAAQLDVGAVAAARKTAEAALPAAERGLGAGDARVTALRILQADAVARAGEADKAVAHVEQALERGLPRPDDAWEAMATAIVDRLAAAAEESDLRERHITMRASQFGAEHAHVASACGLFGAARLAAADWPAAIDFFGRAIALERAAADGDTPEIAANMVLTAHAQRLAGESRPAVATAAEALAAWERLAGARHPGTLAAVDVLVDCKIQAGDTTGVRELLERLSAAESSDDPVRRAGHLVRLADITAAVDKGRAQRLAKEALRLPCWQEGFIRNDGVRLRLAFTAALAAHAFEAVGDSAAAEDAVKRARGLVVDVSDPEPLYRRIEELAARGERPATDR